MKYFIAFLLLIIYLLIIYLIGIPAVLTGGMKTLLDLCNDVNELMLCVDHYSLCSSKINFNKYIFIKVFFILFHTFILVVIVSGVLYSIFALYPALRQLGFLGEKISPTKSQIKFALIVDKINDWVRYICFIFLIVFIVFLCVIYLRG